MEVQMLWIQLELDISAFPVSSVFPPRVLSRLSPYGNVLLGQPKNNPNTKKGQNEREKLYRARQSAGPWTRFRLWLDGAGPCLFVLYLAACSLVPSLQFWPMFCLRLRKQQEVSCFIPPVALLSVSSLSRQLPKRRASRTDLSLFSVLTHKLHNP